MKLTVLTFIFLLLNGSAVDNVPVKSQTKWTCDANWTKIEREEEREFDQKEDLIKWVQFTSSALEKD